MKKLIVTLCVLGILAGFVFWGYLKSVSHKVSITSKSGEETKQVTNRLLAWVPKDTVLFYASSKPVAPSKIAQLWKSPRLKKWRQESTQTKLTDLITTIVQSIEANTFGLPSEVDLVIYAQGLIPIVQISLTDPQQFHKGMESIAVEYKEELQLTRGKNSWVFTDKSALIVATNKHSAWLLIKPHWLKQFDLEQLITTKPTSPAQIKNLFDRKIQEKATHHQFFGYLNTELLLNSLTAHSTETLSQHIKEYQAEHLAQQGQLSQWQTVSCQRAIAIIAAKWPRISWLHNDKKFQARIESYDSELMGQLIKLRGFIPKHVMEPAPLTLLNAALGLNVNEFLPLMQLVLDRQGETSRCKPIANIQSRITSEVDINALGMQVMLLSGVQGISLSLAEQSHASQGEPLNLSTAIALTTDSKMKLMLLKTILPSFGLSIPSRDGQSISLNHPLLAILFNQQAHLSMIGSHLVLHTQDRKQQLSELKTDKIKPTALFHIHIESQRIQQWLKNNQQTIGTLAAMAGEFPKFLSLITKQAQSTSQSVTVDVEPEAITINIEKNNP